MPFEVSGDASPTRAADSSDSEVDSKTTESQMHRRNSKDQGPYPIPSNSTGNGQLQLAEGETIDLGAFCEWSNQIAALEPSLVEVSGLTNTTTSLPPSILYNSFFQRFEPILERCSRILLPDAPANTH